MGKPRKDSRTFRVELSILDYLQGTRGDRSLTQRANELLRRAVLQEQNEALEKEAAEFYAATGKAERAESRGFALASKRSLIR